MGEKNKSIRSQQIFEEIKRRGHDKSVNYNSL